MHLRIKKRWIAHSTLQFVSACWCTWGMLRFVARRWCVLRLQLLEFIAVVGVSVFVYAYVYVATHFTAYCGDSFERKNVCSLHRISQQVLAHYLQSKHPREKPKTLLGGLEEAKLGELVAFWKLEIISDSFWENSSRLYRIWSWFDARLTYWWIKRPLSFLSYKWVNRHGCSSLLLSFPMQTPASSSWSIAHQRQTKRKF